MRACVCVCAHRIVRSAHRGCVWRALWGADYALWGADYALWGADYAADVYMRLRLVLIIFCVLVVACSACAGVIYVRYAHMRKVSLWGIEYRVQGGDPNPNPTLTLTLTLIGV